MIGRSAKSCHYYVCNGGYKQEINHIEINKSEGIIHYSLPVPSRRGDMQPVGVQPIDNYGGAGGARTPYLLNAIQALSQMSYSPTAYMLL